MNHKTQLYFLSDQYYMDFPDKNLMKNKEPQKTSQHNRPCFLAFPDKEIPDIFWMIPLSSQYEKYKKIEQHKLNKYGFCNTIRFGKVLKKNAAFLIQNICPATEKYLIPYTDKNNIPIPVDYNIAKDVIKNAEIVLSRARYHRQIVFPDIYGIYQCLEIQLEQESKF